ncbi:MAG: pur operon repressor [Bacilli bacterium]|nr:pur operon repressor [Bacilli bacterium]
MRRSERIVRLTQEFLQNPYETRSLTAMADRFDAAKSSLSEDLTIIREVLDDEGLGTLETQPGASGGVRYIPRFSSARARAVLENLRVNLETPDRLLPGGYLYLSDLLGEPDILDKTGRIFADMFHQSGATHVLTVEAKGIAIAIAAARYLRLPSVVIRRDNKVIEGSAVSINFVSGSRRIQTMSLSRRSLPEHARVLVLDDFMKAGGTAKAMIDMMKEFDATVVGVGVFMSTTEPEIKMVSDYVSLLTLNVTEQQGTSQVQVSLGAHFS